MFCNEQSESTVKSGSSKLSSTFLRTPDINFQSRAFKQFFPTGSFNIYAAIFKEPYFSRSNALFASRLAILALRIFKLKGLVI